MEPDYPEQVKGPQDDSLIYIIRFVLCVIFLPIIFLVIFFSLGYTQGALVETFQRSGHALEVMLEEAQNAVLPKHH